MKDEVLIRLGKEIKKRRIDIGISREELSKRSGYSLSFIGYIERGERNLSIKTLLEISKALDNAELIFFVEK